MNSVTDEETFSSGVRQVYCRKELSLEKGVEGAEEGRVSGAPPPPPKKKKKAEALKLTFPLRKAGLIVVLARKSAHFEPVIIQEG